MSAHDLWQRIMDSKLRIISVMVIIALFVGGWQYWEYRRRAEFREKGRQEMLDAHKRIEEFEKNSKVGKKAKARK